MQLPATSPGSSHFIARLGDLAPDSALAVELEGLPWLLVRSRGDISAVSGYCTYRGSRIRWDKTNSVFLCESHGCTFDHRGNLIHGLATSPLETLRIRIVDDRIYGARDRIRQ
jgi:nitrite reductase/ring-hydroxylating ferredoxin subunit